MNKDGLSHEWDDTSSTNHTFLVWQIMTWPYDRNVRRRRYAEEGWSLETNYGGFRNQKLSVSGFYLQPSEYRTARSWQGGWGDISSMSLQLLLLPEGLSASVLGPSGGKGGGGLFLGCWELANKPPCYCANANLLRKNSFRVTGLPCERGRLGREGGILSEACPGSPPWATSVYFFFF